MANHQSTIASNKDANPVVFNRTKGAENTIMGNVAVPVTFATADTIELCDIPANAVITQILIENDDLGTTATVDLGVRKLDGTVVDADLFAVNKAFGTATTQTDYRSDALDHNTTGQRLYELLGLTEVDQENPEYELYLTADSVATPLAGDVSFIVRFTDD